MRRELPKENSPTKRTAEGRGGGEPAARKRTKKVRGG